MSRDILGRPMQRLAIACTLASILVARTARADEPAPQAGSEEQSEADQLEEARRLFREGVELHDQGRHREALERYRIARGGATSPQLLFNIAACEEALRLLRDAMRSYREAEEEARRRGNDDIAAKAAARALDLETRTPRIVVQLPDDAHDVEVTLDGAPIATSIRVDPGNHRLTARDRRGLTFDLPFDAKEHEERTIHVVFLETTTPGIVTTTPAPWTRPSYAPAAIAGGAAAALGIAALATFLSGRESKHEYERLNEGPVPGTADQRAQLKSEGEALYVTSTVFGIAGTLATGAAVYFLVRSATAKPPKSSAMARILPTIGGLSVGGTF